MLKLSTYFRSTAAYRVRIALQLKGLPHDLNPIHLVRDGGEHKKADYLKKNPAGLVPIMETEEGIISQSLAILEYLEEAYPEPPLLPSGAYQRSRVRALSLSIACDMHPLNNLRVLQFLVSEMGLGEESKNDWYQHWIAKGFTAIETVLSKSKDTGPYCFGETPSMADCCLIPQVYNAERFNCPMHAYPTIARIAKHCLEQEAFIKAKPENQSDAL